MLRCFQIRLPLGGKASTLAARRFDACMTVGFKLFPTQSCFVLILFKALGVNDGIAAFAVMSRRRNSRTQVRHMW